MRYCVRFLCTLGLCTLGLLLSGSSRALADELQFRDQPLPTRLTVGYAVRLLDMNGDGRRDIVILDSKRLLWLENPNWEEHVIFEDPEQENDNVCFAPYDIDGDGRLDFAIGSDWQYNNTDSGGRIGWISQGPTPDAAWQYHAIGEEPTVHRIRFADLNGDGRKQLIVAPLKGRNTTPPEFDEQGVRLLAYSIPEDPAADPWEADVISDQLHVVHNFWMTDLLSDATASGPDLLVASFEGVNLLRRREDGSWRHILVGAGDQQSSPRRGASEIKAGTLAEGTSYLASIEPWHGNKVVVYTPPESPLLDTEQEKWLWNRQVLDDQLEWGHAVWCANLDGDDDQELIIGVRDDLNDEARRGLRIYDPQNRQGTRWKRSVFDPGSVAIEDLAAADLNGDGRVDIVAVGRQTHNVKIYWNETNVDR